MNKKIQQEASPLIKKVRGGNLEYMLTLSNGSDIMLSKAEVKNLLKNKRHRIPKADTGAERLMSRPKIGVQKDEYYTFEHDVELIVKYLKPNSLIWCPFPPREKNKPNSFKIVLERLGHRVIETHTDFLETPTPDRIDYVIDNPPFSIKTKILTRLYKENIPFALFIGCHSIYDSYERHRLYAEYGLEILFPYKKPLFINNNNGDMLLPKDRSIPWKTAYFCKGVLPQPLIFEKVDEYELRLKDKEPTIKTITRK